MGKYDLDNTEYDNYLAANKKAKELRARHIERKQANKGYSGWHFGLGDKPIYTKDKEAFRRELDKRNLVMREEVHKNLK